MSSESLTAIRLYALNSPSFNLDVSFPPPTFATAVIPCFNRSDSGSFAAARVPWNMFCVIWEIFPPFYFLQFFLLAYSRAHMSSGCNSRSWSSFSVFYLVFLLVYLTRFVGYFSSSISTIGGLSKITSFFRIWLPNCTFDSI